MLTFRIRFQFLPARFDEAAGALRSLAGPVRSQPGCLATSLLQDLNDRHTLVYVEEWRDLEHFERHLLTVWFRTVVAVMELAADSPTVAIDDVASRRGFELVEEVLGVAPFETQNHETA